MANILALRQWYHHVRPIFVGPHFPQPLYDGLQRQIDRIIAERMARFDQLIDKAKVSLEYFTAQSKETTPLIEAHQALIAEQKTISEIIHQFAEATFMGKNATFDPFHEELNRLWANDRTDYVDTIQSLDAAAKTIGTRWLNSVVEEVVEAVTRMIPGVIL